MVAKKRSRSGPALIALCLPKNEAPALTPLLAELASLQFSLIFMFKVRFCPLNQLQILRYTRNRCCT